MIDSALQNEQMYQFSLNLCTTIKKHECLHDHKSLVFKNTSPECEAAWKVVAEECGESVEQCGLRWKTMCKSFLRALRRGSRKYYLHEHMEYMIPHLLGCEYEPDDKTSGEANGDIKLSSTDVSVQQDEKKKNEKTTMGIKLTNTGTIPVEKGGDKNPKSKENINKDQQKNNGFDSDTTSADESHIAKSQATTDTDQVEEFIVTEIDESVSCANGSGGNGKQMEIQVNEGEQDGVYSNNVSFINEDDMESAESISGRSRYRRACKRGLDAEIVSELTTEKHDDKRPRRSAERRKTLASIALEEFNKRKSLPNMSAKKSETKVQKAKSNKNNSLKVKALEQQPENMEAEVNLVYQDSTQNKANKATPVIVATTESTTHISEAEQILPITANNFEVPANIFYPQTFNQMTNCKKPLMIDTSTITNLETRNSSCQYELQQDALDFDDTFLNSLKPQLKLMNGRQKLNFKRKVFQSLMEVFDDASNFPNTNEYIVLPPSGAPRFDTTTNGELRLMRELVSLVQAAKTTPEIMNETEKETAKETAKETEKETAKETVKETATITPVLEKPSNSQNSKVTPLPSSSQTVISPPLDDEEPTYVDDTPHSLGEILSKCDDDDVLGLPRRVIHKVVKVSGPNGSTVVTGEGAKKRVYRIYPKTFNTTEPNRGGLPKNGGNTGTFYVNPSKGNVNTTQINQHNKANKMNLNNLVTFRTVQKSPNISFTTPTSSNSRNKTQPFNMLINKPPVTSTNTPTQILDPATGLFTLSNVSNALIANNDKISNIPMLPSNSVPQRILFRAQGGIPGKLVSTQSGLMQRRYSICGTAPLNGLPVSAVPSPLSKSIVQKSTVSSNGNSVNSAASQIHISKPVSLNTNAANLQTKNQNYRPVINTNTTNSLSNKISSSTVTSNTTPSSVNLNNKVFEKSTSSTNSNNTSFEQSKSSPPNQERPRIPDTPQQPRDIPVLETAGTIAADTFTDPLLVKPFIKNEPLD